MNLYIPRTWGLSRPICGSFLRYIGVEMENRTIQPLLTTITFLDGPFTLSKPWVCYVHFSWDSHTSNKL